MNYDWLCKLNQAVVDNKLNIKFSYSETRHVVHKCSASRRLFQPNNKTSKYRTGLSSPLLLCYCGQRGGRPSGTKPMGHLRGVPISTQGAHPEAAGGDQRPSSDAWTRCIINGWPKRQVGASWRLDRANERIQHRNQESHQTSATSNYDFFKLLRN